MIAINGNTNWAETHFEIVKAIVLELERETPSQKLERISRDEGTGGLWELAESLTDKFEKENEDREWDGEYFDELEKFLSMELGIN